MMDHQAAFAGVRVIDLSTCIAGPYATMFMADHGAEVVKIEAPGGDPYRSAPGFQVLNRGKRSVVLDITNEADARRVLGLIGSADIFVTDLDQYRIRQFGLSYPAARAMRPDLLYLSLAPYGEQGPLVGRPWSPALVAAAGGVMDGQASYGGQPVMPVIPAASYGTGVLAAATLAAALYARVRTGQGRMLHVSELAGALAMQIGTVTADLAPDSQVQLPLLGPRGPVPPYALFQAGDGRWFFLACGTRDFFDRMLVAIGHPEQAADPRLKHAPWGLTTQDAYDALMPLLEETFSSQPLEHWLALFADADVPAQPVQSRDEFFNSALVRENDLRTSLDHPQLGAVEMMSVPLTIEGATGRAARRAPLLGEHTAEVLGALPATDIPAVLPEVSGREEPRTLPPLLDGVQVLDLAAYIAGPVASRHLAMLGAAVLKVEPPMGDPFRVLALGFQGWNLGKRSIAVNLQHERGVAIFNQLLERADVVVENYRPGVAARLGVDADRLRALRPGLVYASSSGFGDAERHRDRPAFDPLLQALSGAMQAQGGDGEPVYVTIALHDVMTPLLTAFGVCTALYLRERDAERRGREVRTSLAAAALAVQAGEFVHYVGAPAPATGGRDYAGPSAGERAYLTSTGHWLLVEAATAEQRKALANVIAGGAFGVVGGVDAEALASAADGPTAVALAEVFRGGSFTEWVRALDAARVPYMEVTRRRQLLRADAVRANHLVAARHHPIWGQVTTAGMLVEDRGAPPRDLPRAPMLGEQTLAVLEGLGYERIADYPGLVGSRAIGVPQVDLPPEELLGIVYPGGHGKNLPTPQLHFLFNLDVG